MLTRRRFLQAGLLAGASVVLPWRPFQRGASLSRAYAAGSPLDPTSISKFVEPLVIPPAMPFDSQADGVTQYSIGVRQFVQQVLPSDLPTTTVWGYGHASDAGTFHFPGFTVEARVDETVRVTWVNQLVDDPDSAAPQYIPHLLPVDQTVHWANPATGPDLRGEDTTPYLGPVPIIPHLHGGHSPADSDGFPESWWLPAASNIPEGYVKRGTHFNTREDVGEGAALFEYPNDQRATTLWYHDHSLGMTRLNVYAGMAGFWLLRDDAEADLNLPGPAPRVGDAPGTKYYEIPLAIQDRSFNEDGSLFYPDNRAFFDEYEGPYFPDGIVPPIWNPEFFGNAMVVNGKTWPYLDVEPRLYRFRILNGCGSRFLVLKFDQDVPFHQIGSDGGLLPDAPLVHDQLLVAPAERFDVIIDFSQFAPGDTLTLLNLGPDAPFGGLPIEEDDLAQADTTGQVMQFRVVDLTSEGNAGAIPAALPPVERLESDLPERYLTLNEEMTDETEDAVPVAALMGTSGEGPLAWMDPVTENPVVGTTETWSFVNLTGDAHPVHVHLVMFQVVGRTPYDPEAYHEAQEAYLLGRRAGDPPNPYDFATGETRPPEPNEMGWKDTVISYPEEITRIRATFNVEGMYVWHCHILEHEDNEMMRPFAVIPE